MELKRLLTKFIYRIEPKPGGGFIAHPSDPTVAPLEAPTREELQQKIQANIAAALGSEFPGLKMNLANKEMKFDFHVEHKPGGGFAIHSASPQAAPIEASHSEDLEHRIAEKLIGLVGEGLVPELSETIATAGGPAEIKVVVNKKVFVGGTSGSNAVTQASLGSASAVALDSETQMSATSPSGDFASNSPITPEGTNWAGFALMFAALLILGCLYFFLHYRG